MVTGIETRWLVCRHGDWYENNVADM